MRELGSISGAIMATAWTSGKRPKVTRFFLRCFLLDLMIRSDDSLVATTRRQLWVTSARTGGRRAQLGSESGWDMDGSDKTSRHHKSVARSMVRTIISENEVRKNDLEKRFIARWVEVQGRQ